MTTDVNADLGFDRQEEEAQRAARNLLVKVTLALKLAAMHQLTNAALGQPVAAMIDAVNQLMAGKPIPLASIGENFFLSKELLRLDSSSFESGQTLRAIFKRLGIHELAFTRPLDEAGLRHFLAAYQACFHGQAPGTLVKGQFSGIVPRVLNQAEQDAYGAKKIDNRQNVLKQYVGLSLAVKEASEQLRAGRPARYARLRRSLHALADAAAGYESLLVGLTRLPSLRGEPHYHLASVAALCLVMGRKLGLPRPALSDLGLAALLHDLARAELPAYSGFPEELEARETGAARVPLKSMLRACSGGLSASVLSLASCASELPLRADSADAPSSVARLIAVPCAFDRMTAPQHPARALPPDQALRLILDRAPGRFDLRAARLFAGVVGFFPVGTTVRLTTGEVAVVLETPRQPAMAARPRVRVVQSPKGRTGYVLDLAEASVPSRIAAAIDPIDEPMNVNVAQLLLA